ncbi:hypothetical protein TWF696_003747 [Orbilia brochopaga]|uniref:Uncharacterized protein n=1 Tax=Orbilia brochopaga TaxID=3140254 RepID=A0AAV9V733_9PEZI
MPCKSSIAPPDFDIRDDTPAWALDDILRRQYQHHLFLLNPGTLQPGEFARKQHLIHSEQAYRYMNIMAFVDRRRLLQFRRPQRFRILQPPRIL